MSATEALSEKKMFGSLAKSDPQMWTAITIGKIQSSDVKSSPKLQLGTMKSLATKYEAETYWSSSIGL